MRKSLQTRMKNEDRLVAADPYGWLVDPTAAAATGTATITFATAARSAAAVAATLAATTARPTAITRTAPAACTAPPTSRSADGPG